MRMSCIREFPEEVAELVMSFLAEGEPEALGVAGSEAGTVRNDIVSAVR